MTIQVRWNRKSFAILFVTFFFISNPLFANLNDSLTNPLTSTADDKEPLTIKSDSFHFDNKTGVATYTGNVVATQGSRNLTGDKLEIYRNMETSKIDRIIVKGTPAYYKGITEVDKPPVNAKANLITYIVATKFLTLTGDAMVEQAGDVYHSEQIEYDGLKNIVYSPPSLKGQTTIILKGKDVNI